MLPAASGSIFRLKVKNFPKVTNLHNEQVIQVLDKDVLKDRYSFDLLYDSCIYFTS